MIRLFIDLLCKTINPAWWTGREKREEEKRERLMVGERDERGRMCTLYWPWAWISLICERLNERTVERIDACGTWPYAAYCLDKSKVFRWKKENDCERSKLTAPNYKDPILQGKMLKKIKHLKGERPKWSDRPVCWRWTWFHIGNTSQVKSSELNYHFNHTYSGYSMWWNKATRLPFLQDQVAIKCVHVA